MIARTDDLVLLRLPQPCGYRFRSSGKTFWQSEESVPSVFVVLLDAPHSWGNGDAVATHEVSAGEWMQVQHPEDLELTPARVWVIHKIVVQNWRMPAIEERREFDSPRY